MNLVEMKTKFAAAVSEIDVLAAEMQSDDAKNTPENLKTLQDKTSAAAEMEIQIKTFAAADALKVNLESKGRQLPPDSDTYEPATVNDRRILSIGESFVESEAYKSSIKGGDVRAGTRVSVEAKGFLAPSHRKTVFDSVGTGLNSAVNYQGGMVMLEQERLTIRNLLSVGETTLNAVPFIKETSYTNAADTVAEGEVKPEATFATEPDLAPVKKIAVIGRVTDEMYADFPMMRDYVNNRLRFMVIEKEEQQLLAGTGTGSQIKGILNTSGIQTQAKGADSVADAIFKAITKVRANGKFEPDGIVINPLDWEILRLLKDANGQYYGGGMFTGAYGNQMMAKDQIWGLPAVITTAIAAGTALVGAFKLGAQIWDREGVKVESTNTDGEDFRYNRMAIRVEERLALTVYRPLAFATVTAIA